MRNRKIWKQLMAMALCAALVIPAPMVLAEEGQVAGESAYAGSAKGAADGFEIDEEGILTAYTGTDTEVEIPNTVIEIQSGVFSDCNNITSVSIPNSVVYIGSNAFKGCTALEDITIPESVVDIGANAFSGTKWLENQREKDPLVVVNGILVDGQKSSGTVTIPGTVTSIGEEAFYECSALEHVVIPANVEEIGWTAFYGCSGLKSVNISGEGLVRIQEKAFRGCEQLEDMILPKSVTYIGEHAFSNCSSLTELIIPANVVTIDQYAFSGCIGLTELIIPASVTSIEGGAFSDCSGLESIKVEKENMVYDSRENCNAIIETESNALIAGCKNTVIPGNVVRIGSRSFKGCSGLKSVVIPKSVKGLNSSMFLDCSGLESIKVEDGNERFDSREDCNAIIDKRNNALLIGCKKTIIPQGVEIIQLGAFLNCSGLTSVKIPISVTDIKSRAFAGCSDLTNVEIPKSVRKIGERAFLDCKNLKSVQIPMSVYSIDDCSFGCYDYREENGRRQWSKVDDFVIYGKNGSMAERYANEYGFTFSPIAIDGSETDISTAVVTLEKDNYAYDGTAKTPVVTVELDEAILEPDIDYDVTYSNNIEIGTAKVTVTGKGHYIGSVEKTFIISKDGSTSETNPPKDDSTQNDSGQADISRATVTLEKNSYIYDGTAKTPFVIVTMGGKTLTLNTDYTAAYRNNINPGTATVIVTGKGKYKGTATKNFIIQNASQNDSQNNSQSDGKNLTCAKTIYKKVYGDKSFSLGIALKNSNGTITCTSSNKKVVAADNKGKVTIKGTGIAVVTVKVNAVGNYKAESIKITVEVSPKKQAIKSLKPQTGRKLKVSWKKDKQATGYQIQYSTDKKFKKGTKTDNVNKNKTISKTISKLKAGKKYYVRVRSYKTVKVNGKTKKLYGTWSGGKRSGSIKK